MFIQFENSTHTPSKNHWREKKKATTYSNEKYDLYRNILWPNKRDEKKYVFCLDSLLLLLYYAQQQYCFLHSFQHVWAVMIMMKGRTAKRKESEKKLLVLPDITIFAKWKTQNNNISYIINTHTFTAKPARIHKISSYNTTYEQEPNNTILKIKSNKRNKFVVRETANVL